MRLLGTSLMWAFFTLCTFTVAGCGDDSSSADMSVGPDLSASGSNCLQVVTCVQACPAATQVTCAMGCAAKGTTKAQGQYTALISCAYGVCTQANDGGTAACASATDTSASCVSCLATAAQSATCSAQLNACLGG